MATKNRGARTKVLKTKCKNRRTRTKEQNLRNKIFGTKSPNSLPFFGGKIDQKSDFWNIVLLCSRH